MKKKFCALLAGATVIAGVLTVVSPANAGETTIKFTSDNSWGVFSQDPANGADVTSYGLAEKVCLNAQYPAGCPSDAVQFNFFSAGWGADLSTIPGAAWIWAPGTTGETYPADLQLFAFSKSIHIAGTPISAAIQVAADDSAQVVVNGHNVGSIGSVTDMTLAAAAQGPLTTFDIVGYLVNGVNTITVIGQNGPAFYAGYSEPTAYSQNPAGVVFGGEIRYDSVVTVPIDIKPGSAENTVNLGSEGVIPVAVASTPTFSATMVNPATVIFAKVPVALKGNQAPMVSFRDINSDGVVDAVFMFRTEGLQVASEGVELTMEGKTFDGTEFVGSDLVRIVP